MRQETMTFPRTRQGVRDLDRAPRDLLPVSGGPARRPAPPFSAGHWACAAGGGTLMLLGLARVSRGGLGLCLVGGALLGGALSDRLRADNRPPASGVSDLPSEEVVYRR